ncbi:MAG: AraC family transcriptional regulator [Dehalococcoidia bacterium]
MVVRPSKGAAPQGTVLARAVARIVDVGLMAGVSRQALLAAAGVTDEELGDPDARLPVATEIALWQLIAEHTSDPGFAIQAGAAFRIRAAGLLGYVALFSATLGDALRRVQRYGRVLTAAVEFRLHEGLPELVLATEQPVGGRAQAIAQTYRLAAVLQACRELSGVALVPSEVCFTYPQPPDTAAHRAHFRCPLRFDAPRACLLLRASDLALPIPKADETLAGYLSEYAEQVLQSLTDASTTLGTVRAAIWSLLGSEAPSLERVAAASDMSSRTLQRRLAEEGTSLTKEIEEVRKVFAKAALLDPGITIEEISLLLGYAEPSTFYRSFKRWTGTTPRRFRERAA